MPFENQMEYGFGNVPKPGKNLRVNLFVDICKLRVAIIDSIQLGAIQWDFVQIFQETNHSYPLTPLLFMIYLRHSFCWNLKFVQIGDNNKKNCGNYSYYVRGPSTQPIIIKMTLKIIYNNIGQQTGAVTAPSFYLVLSRAHQYQRTWEGVIVQCSIEW